MSHRFWRSNHWLPPSFVAQKNGLWLLTISLKSLTVSWLLTIILNHGFLWIFVIFCMAFTWVLKQLHSQLLRTVGARPTRSCWGAPTRNATIPCGVLFWKCEGNWKLWKFGWIQLKVFFKVFQFSYFLKKFSSILGLLWFVSIFWSVWSGVDSVSFFGSYKLFSNQMYWKLIELQHVPQLKAQLFES